MEDTARDTDGNDITQKVGGQERPVRIQDIQKYVQQQKDQEAALAAQKLKPVAYPVSSA